MIAYVLRNVMFFMYLTWGEALALKFLDRERLVPELMTRLTDANTPEPELGFGAVAQIL